MSLHVLKSGLLDTLQDQGRFGFAHLGINPSGVMDRVGRTVANCLVGNPPTEAVLELHFPAAEMRLETDVLLALAGADFGAQVQGVPLPIHRPVILKAGAVLKFQRAQTGARCYLAVRGGFEIEPWLGSCSTNLAAGAGGWQGRALPTGAVLAFRQKTDYATVLNGETFLPLPWSANVTDQYAPEPAIRFCLGPEYAWLTKTAQHQLEQAVWRLSLQSDRMGYRLQGPDLQQQKKTELVSSAVAPGTIQLLPNGQLIILMADSQTTGGYPRIGQLIQADMPRLAQLQPGQQIQFHEVALATAFAALRKQTQVLQKLQVGCALKFADLHF